MPTPLAEDRRRMYDEKGYLAPIHVISEDDMGTYRERLEAAEASRTDAPKLLYQSPHMLLPWLHDIIRHPNLLVAAEDLFGPDLMLLNSGFRVKDVGRPAHSPWHQDEVYLRYTDEWATCLFAFTNATADSGCLQVIEGSHTWDILPHVDSMEGEPMQTRGQRITTEFDMSTRVPIELGAGEATLFHPRLIHGSEPNTTETRHVALLFEYCPTRTARIGSRDSGMLLRGEDRFRNFDLDPMPVEDFGPAELASHRQRVKTRTQESYKESPLVPRPFA